MNQPARNPVVSDVTLVGLQTDPHSLLHRLRRTAPVAWVPVLGGWFITSRDVAVRVMRDADAFTVDHPAFSTAQVVGPSMLSLDGAEHERHRGAFAPDYRHRTLVRRLGAWLTERARLRVAELPVDEPVELRSALAGPYAVDVVAESLGLAVESSVLADLYRHIAGAVHDLSVGDLARPEARVAMAELDGLVMQARAAGGSMLASRHRDLTPPEILSNAAVMLFGGIETGEGMNATALWYLLTEPGVHAAAKANRALLSGIVEESLRLEPAAARVDRYATRDVTLDGVEVQAGDLMIVSLTAANRDPAHFPHPDRFDLERATVEVVGHVSFAQGPHACLGIHLARMETVALLNAVLDQPGAVTVHATTGHRGLVFRKPEALVVSWER